MDLGDASSQNHSVKLGKRERDPKDDSPTVESKRQKLAAQL
jgi:hypothetical protein